MQSDAPNSASGSGEMSRAKPKPPTSEAELLAREAAEARAAIGQSLGELRERCTTENVARRWIGRHPWLTLAAASVAGVALARAATAPRRSAPPRTDAGEEKPAVSAPPGPPWWMSLVMPLTPMLMSVVEDLVRSMLGVTKDNKQ